MEDKEYKGNLPPSNFKSMGTVECWNDHPTWNSLLMAPVKVWTSWPNAKIQICNSFTPAESNLDWQQVTTTQKWQQRIVTEKLFHVYIFLLYHTMLIFYTGLVSVYMPRSLFMWYCQGSGNQLKSDPMPLLSHFLLFKVHDKVGGNSHSNESQLQMGQHVARESSTPMNWLGRSAGLVPESHCGQHWRHRSSISAATTGCPSHSLSAP